MSSPVTSVTADRATAATALLIAALTVSACSPGPTASPSAAAGAASPSRIAATTPPAATPAVAFDGLPVFVDVPNYKGDDARTGVMAGPGPVAAPSEAWHVHVPCSITDHTPVLATGLLLIGCDAPTLYALDARTGATRWTATLDGSLQGSPGVEDGTVYAADAGGSLKAFDLLTGAQRWSVDVDPFRHPGVVDGTLYVGTTIGRVLGLDPATGAQRWSWQAPEGVHEVIATVVADTLYASADDGSLYAVALADGSVRWSQRVLSGRVSTPAVAGDLVYVSALQNGSGDAGGLYALDRSTGAERWRQEAPDGGQLAPPTVADGIVYAPSANSGLFAFDGLTGSVRWNVAKTVPMGGHPPAITADVVYAAANRSIGAYDRADGRQLWSVDLGEDTDGSAIVSGGMAFIGDNAGSVLALAEPALAERIAAMGPSPTPTGSAAPAAPAPSLPPVLARDDGWDGSAIGTGRVDGLDLGPDGNLYAIAATTGEIVVVDPGSGRVVRRWGEPGTGKGQFDFLRENGDDLGGVAVAGDGTVYVADSQNRRVQVFDAQGSYVSQFGRFGEEDGQFLEPIDVAVGPDGDVYVVDDLRDDIQRFSPAGQHRATIGRHGTGDGELNSTGGIFVGGDGTLYNADWTSERVQAWDDAGSFLWSFGTPGSGPLQFTDPSDVVVDGTGRIYVIDHGRVQAFSADRTYLGEAPVPDSMMLAGDDEHLYAAESGSGLVRLAIAAP